MPSTRTCTTSGRRVYQVLTDDEDAGHVVGPVVAGLEEDAAVAGHLGLRGEGFAHDEAVDGTRRECSRHVGRGHLHHLDVGGIHVPDLHGAEEDEALVGEAAGDGDGAAFEVGEGFDGAVVADDERAAVAVAEVDDLDGDALRFERDGHGGDDEGGLDLVGDEGFLHLGEALEHAGEEEFAVVGELGDVVGDGAGELAGDGEIGYGDLALGFGAVVVEDGGPVDVEPGVHAGDEDEPCGGGEEEDFFRDGSLIGCTVACRKLRWLIGLVRSVETAVQRRKSDKYRGL